MIGADSPFLKDVADRLSCFLVHEGGDDVGTTCGKEALALKLGEAKRKPDGNVNAEVLHIFSVYSWLLSDGQRKEVQELVKVAATQFGSQVAASSASSSAGAAQHSKAAKKAAGNLRPEEVDSTLALFRKKCRS